jgi:hypothetical protein
MSFLKIAIITPYYRGDNTLYREKYGYLIGTILHDLDLFKKSSDQEKYDAFAGIYLFSIISVHMDLLGFPRGLDNSNRLKIKMFHVTNLIMNNNSIQKLGIIYLHIKLLKENYHQFESDPDITLNLLDDILIFIIHIILSFNYTNIENYIKMNLKLELILDLELILKNINFKNIDELFFMFDPIIEFNEYGREIILEHHELFYGEKTIVRNFRKITDIKPNNINFSKYNFDYIDRLIFSFKEYL